MAEAYFERSPVIFITSSSNLKRMGRGGFKEIDHNRVAEPITKATISVTAGERIAEAVDKAYDMAVNGKPGPVSLLATSIARWWPATPLRKCSI